MKIQVNALFIFVRTAAVYGVIWYESRAIAIVLRSTHRVIEVSKRPISTNIFIRFLNFLT